MRINKATAEPTGRLVGGGAHQRIAGVRLVAQGYDWAYGDERGRRLGETVLRLLNGRKVERSELTGPGVDLLAGVFDAGGSADRLAGRR